MKHRPVDIQMSPSALLQPALRSESVRFALHQVFGRWQTHLWVVLWMSAQFGLAFYQGLTAGASAEHLRWLGVALGLGTVWSIMLSLVLVNVPGRWASAITLAAAVYGAAFLFVSAFHLQVYGEQIGVPSILAVLDTRGSEGAEFLASTVTPGRVAIAGLVGIGALTLGLLARYHLRFANPAKWSARHAFAFVLAVVAFFPVHDFSRSKAGSFVLNNPYLFTFLAGRESLRVRGLVQDFSPDSPRTVGATLAARSGQSPVHVLVLGESITSRHMSVYGYERPTTPVMSSAAHSFDRYVMADVCSPRHNTAESMLDMLTAGRELELAPSQRPSLISMAREAGYRVVWVSNQAASGITDSMSSAWALEADERVFVNTRGWQEGLSFDAELLPEIERLTARRDGPLLVIVHMLGAHQNYVRRYPAEFSRWGLDAEVPMSVPRRDHKSFPKHHFNAYDNAVLYTDHIVGEILRLAHRRKADSVTFVSDHGQNLGEFSSALFHSMPDGPRQGFEVPLLFWIKPDFASVAGLDTGRLQTNLDQPYQTDRLLDTLTELYGVTWPGHPAEESLFSPEFKWRERRCDGMSY